MVLSGCHASPGRCRRWAGGDGLRSIGQAPWVAWRDPGRRLPADAGPGYRADTPVGGRGGARCRTCVTSIAGMPRPCHGSQPVTSGWPMWPGFERGGRSSKAARHVTWITDMDVAYRAGPRGRPVASYGEANLQWHSQAGVRGHHCSGDQNLATDQRHHRIRESCVFRPFCLVGVDCLIASCHA